MSSCPSPVICHCEEDSFVFTKRSKGNDDESDKRDNAVSWFMAERAFAGDGNA